MKLEPNPECLRTTDLTVETEADKVVVDQLVSKIRIIACYLGLIEEELPLDMSRKEAPFTVTLSDERLLQAGFKLSQLSLTSQASPYTSTRRDGAMAQHYANQIHDYFEEALPAEAPAITATD